MASLITSRFLLLKPNTATKLLSSSRSLFTTTTTSSFLCRLRSLSSLDGLRPRLFDPVVRAQSVRRLSSSLGGPQTVPPRKEINLSEGSDLKPWIVFSVPPGREYGELHRDELIEDYVWLVSIFVGSEEEARKKIYAVSTRYYYTVRALLTDEQVNVMKKTLGIRKVVPDSHFDVENMEYGDTKQYGGEPFINGEAVPYDPKYHEAWRKIHGEDEYEEEYVKLEVPGCDREHWVVNMEKPKSHLSRDEIIERYIKTLARVVGSEEEARMKLYSVSTRVSYTFGAHLSDYVAVKLIGLPGVENINADYYWDVENKKYRGEPFINGEAVAYDPKYHEGYRGNACPEFDWFYKREKD